MKQYLMLFLDIQVSDGFLIREQSSSSITGSHNLSGYESTTWLVEPRRTTSVVKFSGTLRHPTRDDKIGKTITAFAHFVYEVSKKSLVFADIQGLQLTLTYGLSTLAQTANILYVLGSPMSANNRDGIVLFDLMTHSVDG